MIILFNHVTVNVIYCEHNLAIKPNIENEKLLLEDHKVAVLLDYLNGRDILAGAQISSVTRWSRLF